LFTYTTPKSEKSIREISMSHTLKKELRVRFLYSSKTGLVFSEDGKTPRDPNSFVKREFEQAVLAAGLTGIVGNRPVLNRTGLTGHYSTEFSYVPDEAIRRGAVGASIFDALEKLGLKLEPVRASVQFLTITHIDKPSEN
jgi:uncharacterized protein (TIGR03435 family)